jgi:two-component system, OmpR family, sensor kinase
MMTMVTMTAGTMTTTEEVAVAPENKDRASPLLSSIRVRLLAWFVMFLTVATVASVLVVRQILLYRLDQRIDHELVQETKELRVLASGSDPETGKPFAGRVRRIFEVYLARNVPTRNEALITFVDGEPFLRDRKVVPYRLDQDPDLVGRWATATETERGEVMTPAGPVEFLAVPVASSGGTSGVFVVAIFRDREAAEKTDPAIAGVAATGVIVLLIGSLLAWLLAERILTPVRKITQAARSISQSDLGRRIDVEGRDEIAGLASTFNDMLDRLEDAFKTQKHFMDDVGHELRTPLTIVRGHLETIDAEPKERTKVMALVADELARMSRLIDDLSLLARSERPDFLDLAVVNVETLTKDVRSKAEAIAPRTWELTEAGRGLIVADGQRVTQALLQLAQNAAAHTAEGDPIAIGSAIKDADARFWVSDSGPGVAADDRVRIFERFARGRAQRPNSDGAGLGLAIVRAIAQAHHGRIELESPPGQGATFSLVVPVDQPLLEHQQ